MTVAVAVAMDALRAVPAHGVGALPAEMGERAAEAGRGRDKAAWRATTAPCIHRLIETGRYPGIARIVFPPELPGMTERFESGRACVLDGIGTRLDLS